ncbi:hypothetical protein P3T18_004742 [Paraburkholderia sp. GAS199]|uniref:hypothetical protein n=1 Tax=Paraburkholderia sp. GAS199 TaxID=3035126 RepID=UPI003D22E301
MSFRFTVQGRLRQPETGRQAGGIHRSDLPKTEMSALTVIIALWAMVAFCAILFIRGSSPRVEPPAKAVEHPSAERRQSGLSIAE